MKKKKKRLKIGRLILANILILTIYVLILLNTPDTPKINFTELFMYIITAVLFNLFIIEK